MAYGANQRREMEQRVHVTRRLIAQGLYKHEIQTILQNKYGIQFRQTARYIARARQMLLAHLHKTTADHRAYSLAWYREMVRDKTLPARDRILAAKRIDELLGLDAPKQLSVSGSTDQPLTIEVRYVTDTDDHGNNQLAGSDADAEPGNGRSKTLQRS